MKIIKAHKNKNGHLYIMVDEIPKLTYEKVGMSYVGSDDNNYFNDFLKYQHGYGNFKAFAGREINIEMKDGSITTLKDHWWDYGTYDKEHEYIGVGLATMQKLQDCFVFCSYYIRKDKLDNLLDEYLKTEKFYDYYEIEDWCKRQYSWYPLIFHGKQLPFVMNNKGDIFDNGLKKRNYARSNYTKYKKGKYFYLKLFKFAYKDNTGRLIKLEDSFDNVARETLPESEFIKYLERKNNVF